MKSGADLNAVSYLLCGCDFVGTMDGPSPPDRSIPRPYSLYTTPCQVNVSTTNLQMGHGVPLPVFYSPHNLTWLVRFFVHWASGEHKNKVWLLVHPEHLRLYRDIQNTRLYKHSGGVDDNLKSSSDS